MYKYINAHDLNYLLGYEVFHPKECIIGKVFSVTEANFSDSIEVKMYAKEENLYWTVSFTHHYLSMVGIEGVTKALLVPNKLLERPIYKLVFDF